MAENEWGSNLSFILAMIGSAVGLGNIWRYPYVLYSNGGGAFYIPYIVAILLMGIPFLILEYGVGYDFKSSFAKAVKKIDSRWEYLGWFLPVAVFTYAYFVIGSSVACVPSAFLCNSRNSSPVICQRGLAKSAYSGTMSAR